MRDFMDARQYGVFKLGQIWTLTDPGGARLGFADREMAIAALETTLAVQRDERGAVLVTLQGRDGRLHTLLNPGSDLLRKEEALGSLWDSFIEAPRASPALSSV
jgi:hypothetical protein